MRTRAWRSSNMRAVLIVALGSSHALAAGIDTYPAPAQGADLLEVERANPEVGHLEPFARLTLTYANDPLVLRREDGGETPIVAHQAGAYGSVGLGFWDRAHAALLVPVHTQSGEGLGDEVPPLALGDLGLDLRYAFLQRQDPLELAIAARLLVPSGSEAGFVGDGGPSLAAKAVVSREFGDGGPLLTGSLGTHLRGSSGSSGLDTDSELLFALAALVPVAERWAVGGEATLASRFDRFFAGSATPAGVLAGVHYRKSSWVFRAGAGPGVTQGVGSPDFRVVAALGSVLGEPDPAAVAPAPVVDGDADGIPDERDACRADPEDPDGFEDEDGCPDLDDDADGVPDSADRCPRESEDKDSFEDEDGCPDADNDGDGVLDTVDRCPLEAEDKDSFEDDDGCPDADNDLDGVPDATDQCPNEKETPNGVSDEDGCPDLLRVEHAEIRTLEPIYFERGKARIQERSVPLLNELVAVIVARADLGNIAIEGHTDDIGSERNNLKLSQQRAEAVRSYLVAHGVPEARVSATGYGEARPLESNRTKEGRERNRRVEFRLVTEAGHSAQSSKGESSP